MPTPRARLLLLSLALCSCTTPAPDGESQTTLGSGSGDASATESGEPPAETSAAMETETGVETETSTETGPMCTGETCDSTLTLTFTHSLPLLEGPHRIDITTPIGQEINCSVETTPEGSKSCFGFAFVDLSWTSEAIVVLMTNPFFDTIDNPEALPFASVMVHVERGDEVLLEAELPIEAGEPAQPDPCGPTCWQAAGGLTIE